jgi:hypothetical protein
MISGQRYGFNPELADPACHAPGSGSIASRSAFSSWPVLTVTREVRLESLTYAVTSRDR